MGEISLSWGTIVGACLGIALIVAVCWVGIAVIEWATEFAKPENPNLQDEDEIDHRFY